MVIKKYSNKEPLVFLWVVIPYVIGLDIIVFKNALFNSVAVFISTFLSTAIYLLVIYFIFGRVAVKINRLYPHASQLFKRIRIMLPIFYLMNIGAINLLYFLFNRVLPHPISPAPDTFWWAVLFGCIGNTVITLINEGVANLEAWKRSLNETEKLKNLYQRSKLMGLKGQINPHFLFNCFNTLSGLIEEDTQRAEDFLDDMTIVHRHLLRNDDEMLVPLHQEIHYSKAYLRLIKERFGKALELNIIPGTNETDAYLPPLSMQAILENIIYTNAIHKDDPLKLTIDYCNENELCVEHNILEKKILDNLGHEDGLDNLINKFLLLKSGEISITESGYRRTIKIPLLTRENIIK